MTSTMRTVVIAFCLLLLAATSTADEISDILDSLGFVEREIPVGDDHRAANYSKVAFVVENDDSLVIRKTAKGDDPDQVYFEDSGVKYKGVDNGEWGGGLYLCRPLWVDELLMEGNVRSLIPVENDLYVFEGLAHLSSDYGSVSVIRDYMNPSTPERVTLLPGAPSKVILDSTLGAHVFAIVGHSYLAQLEGEDKLRIIAFDAFWSSLYPTSILRVEHWYVIGIRSGIAVVDARFLHDPAPRYFVPGKP